MLFFDSDGALTNTYKLSGITLSYADIAFDRVLLVGKENIVGDTSSVTVLDKDATEVLKTSTSGKMNAAALGENYVFEAVSGTVYRISFDAKSETEECALSVNRLVATGDSVLVCTSTGCTTSFRTPDTQTDDSGGESAPSETADVELESTE